MKNYPRMSPLSYSWEAKLKASYYNGMRQGCVKCLTHVATLPAAKFNKGFRKTGGSNLTGKDLIQRVLAERDSEPMSSPAHGFWAASVSVLAQPHAAKVAQKISIHCSL